MDPERWRHVDTLYHATLARPTAERSAFLAQACAGDEPLRRDVQSLLDQSDSGYGALEDGALAVAANAFLSGANGTFLDSLPTAPSRIGRYRITDTLGEGGMGVVYAAVDEQLERPIAVKVLRHESATNPAARERFWREARLAASVNHPHICQLYEIGESDGQLFIAMERLEGESLAARLGSGVVSLAETVQIGLEVLAALDALHRRGITHRDLKPSNVFLTPHGAKVLDFGVSLGQTGDVTRRPLTSPGAILGPPKYMAPEQMLGNVVTASADLFATGAILYEMLSGTAAFEADTLPAVMEHVLYGDVASPWRFPWRGGCRSRHSPRARQATGAAVPSAAAMADDLRTALVAEGSEGSRRARPVTRLMVLPFRFLRPDAEFDFLAFSLADAVTNSLSPLESLVVRSTLAAARFASNCLGRSCPPAVIAVSFSPPWWRTSGPRASIRTREPACSTHSS